jgi:hypothetical protein
MRDEGFVFALFKPLQKQPRGIVMRNGTFSSSGCEISDIRASQAGPLSSFPQPHACISTVLSDELDASLR